MSWMCMFEGSIRHYNTWEDLTKHYVGGQVFLECEPSVLESLHFQSVSYEQKRVAYDKALEDLQILRTSKTNNLIEIKWKIQDLEKQIKHSKESIKRLTARYNEVSEAVMYKTGQEQEDLQLKLLTWAQEIGTKTVALPDLGKGLVRLEKNYFDLGQDLRNLRDPNPEDFGIEQDESTLYTEYEY